jgi:hypothetical protein
MKTNIRQLRALPAAPPLPEDVALDAVDESVLQYAVEGGVLTLRAPDDSHSRLAFRSLEDDEVRNGGSAGSLMA